jgi:deoxyribonuclease-4
LNFSDIEAFLAYAKEHKIHRILAHAPYTLNPCSADEHLRDFACLTMEDDLKRMEFTPGNYYNFHPGSHVKQGAEAGIAYIAKMLNRILQPEQHTTVLLETMSGKGSEIGRNFEELREILDRVTLSEHMGVCLDTCHVWDGGYDIVNHLDEVLNEFDQVIGLNRLKAIHLNDSQNPLGSHKDRHAKIGEGQIGKDALIRIVNHPALKELPFYLETPNDLDGYQAEIALMRKYYHNSNT